MAFTTRTALICKRALLETSAPTSLVSFTYPFAQISLSWARQKGQMLKQEQHRAFASQTEGDRPAKQGAEHNINKSTSSHCFRAAENTATVCAVASTPAAGNADSSTEANHSPALTATSSKSNGNSEDHSINVNSSSSSSRGLVSPALLTQVSSTLNRLTGYESIDAIKGSVGLTDKQLQDVKRQLQAAKMEYEAQLSQQNQLHREVTALLQRKSSWVPTDVARFTELYAAEHQTDQAVATAKLHYSQLADAAEQLQLKLVDLIRERYQQEQLWSDKIRRASTWWTWGLMGLHFASFVVVYTFLEPRKRAALQEAVADMLNQHMTTLDGKITQLAPRTAAAAAADLHSPGQGGAKSTAEPKESVLRPKQPPQQQQQQLASNVPEQQELLHVVLQEMQALRQQLDSLPHALLATATTAGSQASRHRHQQPQGHSQWHVPGSAWVSANLAAAGRSVQALWQHTKQRTERVIEQYHAGRSEALKTKPASSSSSSNDGKTEAPLQEQAAPGIRENVDSRQQGTASPQQHKQTPQQQQQQAKQVVQQQEQSAAAAMITAAACDSQQPANTAVVTAGNTLRPTQTLAATKNWSGLLQQLRSDELVLEVTRGQLAAVAAGASAAGAAVAALVVAVLHASGGTAGSRG